MLAIWSRSLDIDPGWENIDFEALEEVQLLQSYLQIDTTHQTGSELEGALFLADLFRREDIPVELLDMGDGRANLIATLEGDDPEALILHNHLDLDPVTSPERWIHPPFSGTIEVPWIYGRGAFDMKSVTVAQLLAMVNLKRQGIRPARTIVFLATSSEETDSELGTLWLLRNRPELFDNAWGVLTEGGVLEARGLQNIKYWGTEFAQKRYVKIIACSPDRGRLEDLLADILERGPSTADLRLTPAVATFLESYAASRDRRDYREFLTSPHEILLDMAKFQTLPSYLQSLFRDDLHLFPIVENPNGNGYQMRITLSLLEDAEPEEAMRRLLPEWMTAGVVLDTLVEPSSRSGSDLGHELFVTITETLEERYGAIRSGPYYQGRSATDARFFRAWGVPSYGFTPFLALTTDTLAITGPNEGIALPAYVVGVDLYKQLLERVAAGSQ